MFFGFLSASCPVPWTPKPLLYIYIYILYIYNRHFLAPYSLHPKKFPLSALADPPNWHFAHFYLYPPLWCANSCLCVQKPQNPRESSVLAGHEPDTKSLLLVHGHFRVQKTKDVHTLIPYTKKVLILTHF